MEMLNKKIAKENQLKNLTSLNLGVSEDSTAKAMATEKVRLSHSRDCHVFEGGSILLQ